MASTYYIREIPEQKEYRRLDGTAQTSYTITLTITNKISTPPVPIPQVDRLRISRADSTGYQADVQESTQLNSSWEVTTREIFVDVVKYLQDLYTSPTPDAEYYKSVMRDNNMVIYARAEPVLKVLYTFNIYAPGFGYPYVFVTRVANQSYEINIPSVQNYYTKSTKTEFNSARAKVANLFT